MQVVVKTPHIDINIRGDKIPSNLINLLKKNYHEVIRIIEDPDEELMDITGTEWWKNNALTPGAVVRICRENKGWTQEQLGGRLGGLLKQNISNIETGKRSISLKMARKLSELFDESLEYFLKEH